MKTKTLTYLTFITTIALFLTACGADTAATEPASSLNEAPATAAQEATQATEAPTATETAVPATEAPTATEIATTESTSAGVSFANDIKPIFDARCIKCHGVEQTKEGLDMQTYENIFAGSRNGSIIEPGNSADSLLVQLIVEGEMPNRGEPVTPEELQLIIDWVDQGALNN